MEPCPQLRAGTRQSLSWGIWRHGYPGGERLGTFFPPRLDGIIVVPSGCMECRVLHGRVRAFFGKG